MERRRGSKEPGQFKACLGVGQWGEGMARGDFGERGWSWLAKSPVSWLKSTLLILQLVEHTQETDSLGPGLILPRLLFLPQRHAGACQVEWKVPPAARDRAEEFGDRPRLIDSVTLAMHVSTCTFSSE